MKKTILFFLLLIAYIGRAQTVSIDSLKESVDEHSMKFAGLDERLSGMESDLAKLTKIKFSGYLQAQYEMYNYQDNIGPGPSTTAVPIKNSFYIRRARIKLSYEPTTGAVFVIQPDYAFDKVTLRDAYVQLNDRWLQTFKLFMGQFNRTSYEVEFSSRSRELLERSRMSGILYPQERDLGAKIEADLQTKYEIPFKFQLAVFNGNYGVGSLTNDLRDVDNKKDVMLRGVYSFAFPSKGLGIDIGAHAYLGNTTVLQAGTFSDANNKDFTAKIGDSFQKRWFGGEMRVYYDFLGGMSLKGEYISGAISGEKGTTILPVANSNPSFNFNGIRDFTGFYATWVKNIGKSNQIAVRYDSWDPNRHLSGNEVTIKEDLKYDSWAFSWQYFYDDNVKIVAGYSLPINESSTKVGGNFTKDVLDNTFTIRIQAGF
ncbi:porin family protein [Flavobacterium psychrotolerans]|uniref:Porin n=1 Tax=Flavobacterium psychrotolerans TaxID=2169410 RepID=A0A2U1JL71_9FLAO|nr:hypothetical protein [Flavobacterium psychrotolerans]PWA05623.1 hypothetical protein DB895_06475 [Flavobacterium psychrotolerans]